MAKKRTAKPANPLEAVDDQQALAWMVRWLGPRVDTEDGLEDALDSLNEYLDELESDEMRTSRMKIDSRFSVR